MNKYQKPNKFTEDTLFDIEIWLEDVREHRMVRDCKYNKNTKIFTQIDDGSTYHLYEVSEWTKKN